ncbi:MAG TPA: hypothetical protein DGG94_18255, partial [Micromonosporaceae bacterium]|nr:hypothetical protein [Micromonosporaceae bacterium]
MKVKRLVATAVAVVGAVAVALVPVTPASAHAGSHAISITGNMTIKDADWPDADDYAHVNFSRNLSINAATPSASARFTGCADEVRIVIDVTVSHKDRKSLV